MCFLQPSAVFLYQKLRCHRCLDPKRSAPPRCVRWGNRKRRGEHEQEKGGEAEECEECACLNANKS